MQAEDNSLSGCAKAEDAAAYARGELTATEAAAFEQHLQACATCRAVADDARFVVAELRKRPEATVTHDLSADVLARIPADAWQDEEEARRFALWRPPPALRAAAGFLMVLGAAWFAWHALRSGASPAAPSAAVRPASAPATAPAPTRSEAIGGALDWLVTAQETSGAWDPERWGGKKEYEISLTGMALLAFMQDREGLRIPARERAVDRGLEYLFAQQKESGAFGPECTGTLYNHGLATLAMVEAYRLKDGPRTKAAVDAALRFIRDRQNDGGGWGYQKAPGQPANTSITAWQIKTLFSARQAGWTDTDAVLRKGLAWLHSVVDEQGLFGYQRPKDAPEGGSDTLTAMGALCFFLAESQGAEPGAGDARIRAALKSAASNPGKQPDFYRWYFVASALSAGKEESYDQLLADLQNVLIRERSRDSAQAGSWDPVGRWSSAGGRLYTTAMATLSLQEKAPGGQAL